MLTPNKKLITIFFKCILLTLLNTSFSQDIKNCTDEERKDLIRHYFYEENKSQFIELGEYKIHSRCKIIGKIQKIGGINWDGVQFIEVDGINYETTEYIFFTPNRYDDNQGEFKEFYPNINFNNLEKITSYEKPFNPTQDPYFDGNNFYYNIHPKRELDDYKLTIPENWKRINTYLWKDNQNSIFLVPMEVESKGQFIDITSFNIDPDSFKHVDKNFYTDKNGLYWFGRYVVPYKGTKHNYQVAKNNSNQEINAELIGNNNYILYDGNLYHNSHFSSMLKIPFTIDDIRFISNSSIHLKKGERYQISPNRDILKDPDPIDDPIDLKSSLPDKKLITSADDITFLYERDGKLYFKGVKAINDCYKAGCDITRKGPLYYVKDENRFYQHFWNSEFFDYAAQDVFIYNQRIENYEPLEIAHFREVDNRFYIYKNALYGYITSIYHDTSDINYKNFQRIGKTNYYTDGESTYYIHTESRYRQDYHFASNRDFTPLSESSKLNEIDFSSLEIIGTNALIDKNNLYLENNVINRENLGFKIRTFGSIPFKLKNLK